jgi:hypothetical protein
MYIRILLILLFPIILFAQNSHIIIDSTTANQLIGNYGNHSRIEPVATFDGKFIVPEKCLDDIDLASAREKLLQAQSTGITQNITELPAVGVTVYQDSLYTSEEGLVKCRQTHARTIYKPSETPALFSFYRENSDTLQWIPNEQVWVNWKRVYEGDTYKCIQSHITLVTWTPDVTPALWQLIPVTNEWTYPVAYKINDIVTYLNKTYRCIQAHTSNVSWNPVATINVLWVLNN